MTHNEDDDMGAIEERVGRIEKTLADVQAEAASCRRWEAEHDGRINAYWEAQFKANAKFEARQEKQAALAEVRRVLAPGGTLHVLDMYRETIETPPEEITP